MKLQSSPETSTANFRLVRAMGGYEKRRVNLQLCLAVFVYLIQELRSDCVRLSNKYAKIVMLSAQFLNQTNKIRETEL